MVLVALAVAFLSGLRATAPDMKLTGHNYFEKQNLADIQIMSTVGLTDEDVTQLLKKDKIAAVEGTYVIDAFASSDTADKVAKVYAIPETDINNLVILEGRMPEKMNECLVDEDAGWELNTKLGDKITLTPQESFEDNLKLNEFTIVGVARSPMYVSIDRGSASIGTGKVAIYMYIPKEVFDSEIYTAIFARVEKPKDMVAFYKDYDDYVEDIIDSLEDFGNNRADLRYATLLGKLDDAQAELDDAKAEADEKLGDADKKLKDAKVQIDDGKRQIAQADIDIADAEVAIADAEIAVADGEQAIADAEEKIADAEKEIADGEKELADALIELEDGEKEYEDGLKEYEDGYKKFVSGRADYYWGAEKAAQGKRELDAQTPTVEAMRTQLNSVAIAMPAFNPYFNGTTDQLYAIAKGQDAVASPTDLDMAFAGMSGPGMPPLNSVAIVQMYEGIKQYDNGLLQYYQAASRLDDAWDEIVDAERELNDAKSELEDARKELDDGWAEYNDGLEELEEGKKKLEEGKADLEQGKADLAQGKADLEQGRADFEQGKLDLAKAKKDLVKGEQEYLDGLKEYEDARAEADEKIGDAQNKIDDARDDLESITEVKWYILSRSYFPGYSGLGQDADRMGNLANVFPVIFFLVAALVCLTTMTRMVEEQRIQIGGLKALGYGTWAISKKYIGYGLLPALVGSIIGLVIGYTLFPTMIFVAYQIMYEMPNIELHQYTNISIACIIAAVICTAVATLAACLATLRENPASLMRPKTPTAGKRVFLERIKFIWNRLGFIQKVTARNLLRYKKRFWMTVIGIGGCTALIIAGFGLRYSLTYILQRQYGALTHYTAHITLDSKLDEEKRAAIEDFIIKDERVVDYTNLRMSALTAASNSGSQSAYLYAIDSDDAPLYLEFNDYKTKETIKLQDGGVYIDQKLSELLGLSVGDEIFLDGDQKAYATVLGIYENYTMHFIYMTPNSYQQIFGEKADLNAYFMHFTHNDIDFCNKIFEDYMSLDGVSGTSRVTDVMETFIESMERIDFVVVIVIISAGALALVVLYNLSNINITERKRELATIKVLGFYDKEVSAYVYRENVILTILGIIVGIVMGHWLHTWLVKSVEIDMMMFGRETNPMSYLFAAVLTILFSIFANVMAHYKMKKIDMVESLKSAE
ncbi:MAG: FtsX-like permease family protein [Clostridia bacterium]|nr:FtsX-like permease family protein [Clostridia bacterium]